MEAQKNHQHTIALKTASLSALPKTIRRPNYDRSKVTPGILHIGFGNFHRAHQAVYMDDLMQLGEGLDWGIIGAGIMEFDAQRGALLKAQDYLSTVVDMSDQTVSGRVTGALIEFCPVDAPSLIAQIADPQIRIISLTITEGGYFIDATTGQFDTQHPDIIADAQSPNTPRTVFGILLAGLRARQAQGHPLPTILSCDNIPGNGHVTRQALSGLAHLISPQLSDWVTQNIAVPNSMVDRITPATTNDTREFVRHEFGIEDASPVMCEPFRQWVIEDNFPLGRPALERVGVTFTDDVSVFETMKLRLLNAGHASIAYVSALLGITYVHDAIADPLIKHWLSTLMRKDVIPMLEPISGIDYHAYLETCITRFGNSAIADTIERLCQDGSNRQPKFILPSINDALKKQGSINGLALELGFWCHYCAKTPHIDDPRADQLHHAAQAGPEAFLALSEVFGDLSHSPQLSEAFVKHYNLISEKGPRGALRIYLEGQTL